MTEKTKKSLIKNEFRHLRSILDIMVIDIKCKRVSYNNFDNYEKLLAGTINCMSLFVSENTINIINNIIYKYLKMYENAYITKERTETHDS